MSAVNENTIKQIKQKEKKDFPAIDIIRGIAIILVLYGHSLQYGSGGTFLNDGLYWENPVMKCIYSFHMPLFMCISGFLFYFSVERNGLLTSLYTRIKRFVPVLFTWAVFLCVLDMLSKGKPFLLKRLVYYFITNFWFLWAILFSCVGIFIVEKIYGIFAKKIQNYERLWGGYYILISLVILGLFFYTPDYYVLASYKYMFPYFMGGYLCGKYKSKFIESNIGIIMMILWLVFLTQFSKESYIYTTGFTLLSRDNVIRQLYIDIYRYLVGFFGSLACIWIIIAVQGKCCIISDNIVANKVNSILRFLGKKSLSIYILSKYIYDRLLPQLTHDFSLNYLVVLLETTLVTVVCLIIAKLIELVPVADRLIIGSSGAIHKKI